MGPVPAAQAQTRMLQAQQLGAPSTPPQHLPAQLQVREAVVLRRLDVVFSPEKVICRLQQLHQFTACLRCCLALLHTLLSLI